MVISTRRTKKLQGLRRGRKLRPLSMLRCTVPGLRRLDQSLVVEQPLGRDSSNLFIAIPLAWQRLCKKFNGLQRKGMCRAWMVAKYKYVLSTQHLTLCSKVAALLSPSNGVLKCTGDSVSKALTYNKLRLYMTKYKLKQRRMMVKELQKSWLNQPNKQGLHWASVAQ